MSNIPQRLFVSFLFVFVSLSAFTEQVFPQDLDDVTISGRVFDSNEAAVAGANVTATLLTTGARRNFITNERGRYRLIELQPGIYSVKVSVEGFATQEKTNLVTAAGQNVQLDFELVPAQVKAEQTINIEDDGAALIDPARTIAGGTLTEREIEELPNNARNPLDLVLLLGGTSEEALSTRELAEDRQAANRLPPTEQGVFSLSGGASYSNNLTIDGLDNNDDRSAAGRFQPSLESVAEVQVVTSQFSAEYGRASGGRVNLRTKSGTKNFRGRVFTYFRDDHLNANTYYNNLTFYNANGTIARAPLPRLPLTEYNPGFTLGGPVILPFGHGKPLYDGRRRTFFFVAYEYNRLEDTTLIDAFVPVGANARFTLPGSTGGAAVCETSNASSTCSNGGAASIAPYVRTISTPNVRHGLTARLDHKLFANNDFTFGWQRSRKRNQRQNLASTTRLPEALQGTSNHTDAFNFTDNHVFGSRTVNQFRFQWSTYKPSYETENPEVPVVIIGYTDPRFATSNARTLVAGNSTASLAASGIFADKRKETRTQLQNSLTVATSRQTIKGGFDWQRVTSRNLDQGDATGTYNFANSGTGTTTTNYTLPCRPAPCAPANIGYSAVQNYLLNQVTRFRQNFGTVSEVKNTYWSLFLNDEIRLRSNLTLNVGVRYEKEKVLPDNNNFGPRLGVAWNAFKNGRGVIRFGAGVFYNRVLLRTIDDFIINGQQELFDSSSIGTASSAVRLAVMRAISANFPRRYGSAGELKDLLNPILAANGFNAGAGFTGFNGFLTRLVDAAQLKIPESYQFNFGYEGKIGKRMVFEVNFTRNKTVHLWGESNPNAPNLNLANTSSGTNFASWTEYLRSVNTGNYRFVLGSTADNVGISAGACTAAAPCTVNLNTINPSEAANSPLGIARAAIDRFRPLFPNTNQQELMASNRNSLYHGMVAELRSSRQKFGAGLSGTFRIAYTLSSLKDDGVNNTSDAEINGDFSREWARGLQDRRHRLAFSGVLETPKWFGKLKFSPLFRWGSSAPFNLSYNGIDRNLDDVANDRMNFSGDLSGIKWRKPGSPVPAALLSRFSLQPIGSKGGNLPRNAGTGPSFYTFDLNVAREFRFREKIKLRPVIEFGNLLNAVVLSYGSGFIDYATFGASAAQQTAKATFEKNFLVPTRAYRPREIRLGLRLDF